MTKQLQSRIHVLLAASVFASVIALKPLDASAQESTSDRHRAYVGINVGQFFEWWEGDAGSATVLKLVVGYDFNDRWGIRGEFGGDVKVCDRNANAVVGGVSQQVVCHTHSYAPWNLRSLAAVIPYLIFSTSAVHRFQDSRVYMTLGLPHVGEGFESPIGDRFAISPEVELSYSGDAASIWPKANLTYSGRPR